MPSMKGYLESVTAYEEPFDSSLIPILDGWDGGAIEHTGGGIFCRRWERMGEEVKYTVTYDLERDDRVALERNIKQDGEEYYTPTGEILIVQASEQTDSKLSRAAQHLMWLFEMYKALGVPDEHLFGQFSSHIERQAMTL